MIVTDFTVQPSTQKTFITLGDYSLVIHRTEELSTWDFTQRMMDFRITLTGRKQFQIKDDIFEKPGQTTKKHSSFQPTIFDQFDKDDLPISHSNVQKLSQPIIGSVVEEVRESTGISFCLPLQGKDSWLLCANADWELHKKNKSILSSRSHKFVYSKQLSKHLVNKKLVSFVFSEELNQTVFSFENDLELIIRKEKKRHLWTIFNLDKSYHLDAHNNGTFTHTVLCPEKLQEKYLGPQYGSAFAGCLYALDLYRDLIKIDKL